MTAIPLPRREALADDTQIEFVDAYVAFDDAEGTMELTPEGRAYYGRWFKRFGLRLDDSDAEGFVKTVMFINRESGLLRADRLLALIASGDLSPEEKAVWSHYIEGDFESFATGLAKIANKIEAVPSNVVELFSARRVASQP
ncbi:MULTISPECIES: hypothetical protein [unclassified Variovorax]|uniref:hypothetical protein n=1 Tax=unclassified Variovorax TaxID=663243 RepID=UPI0013A5B022|nr:MULTISPECIES: hypothetical protein [unclassified Variovorax]